MRSYQMNRYEFTQLCKREADASNAVANLTRSGDLEGARTAQRQLDNLRALIERVLQEPWPAPEKE